MRSAAESDVHFSLMKAAIQLECECFEDMTMSSDELRPIVQPLDDAGELASLSIEGVHSFRTAELDDWVGGMYVPAARTMRFKTDRVNIEHIGGYTDVTVNPKDECTITLSPDNLNLPTLAHEMIHYYEDRLDRYDGSFRQYLLCRLWDRLQESIADLDDRVQHFLELSTHQAVEIDGGRHDLLFFLKCLDVDLRLGVELGTTFGYEDYL